MVTLCQLLAYLRSSMHFAHNASAFADAAAASRSLRGFEDDQLMAGFRTQNCSRLVSETGVKQASRLLLPPLDTIQGLEL